MKRLVLTKQKLTVKQQKFVETYDGNATQAALRAGYSPKTARKIGQENLTKPAVKESIEERIQKQTNALIATREDRQQFWSKIMMDENLEPMARLKASELLGRSELDFVEKRIIEGSAIVFNIQDSHG